MKLDTALSKKLGLKYPFVSAPMFIISNKEMIVAAAEAGILGCMPSLNARTAEKLREDLTWIRQRTDRPFGINITIGLTKPERVEEDMALSIEFDVPVILTSYGNPTALVKQAHEHKRLVFHDVITLAHGKKAVAAGVDGIIAVSSGAGGHAGRISPFVLVPWLKEELKVPILAAGCISDGRQVVASLSLGAELCYIGTRFIASTECGAMDAYKDAVVAAGPEDIVYTDAVSGIHANFIKHTVPEGFTPDRSPEGAKRWRDIWSAGQGVGLIHAVKPMGEIVEDLAREAHDTLAAFA
ncbi:MAG: nitronate monooxygenase [Labilithrix sp.]